MSRLKKIFFISIAVFLVIAASVFMISEVAEYYNGFYSENSYKGLFTAILAEFFGLGLMIIHIPAGIKIPFTTIKIPLINFISKMLVLIIFVITVMAAGLHVLKPSIKTLSELNKENLLLGILEQEHKDLTRDIESFQDTNQKVNLAITAKANRRNREEIKELLREKRSPVLPIVEISLIFILRIVIQMSNLLFAYSIGYIYRLPSSRTNSTAGSELKLFNNAIKGKKGKFESLDKSG